MAIQSITETEACHYVIDATSPLVCVVDPSEPHEEVVYESEEDASNQMESNTEADEHGGDMEYDGNGYDEGMEYEVDESFAGERRDDYCSVAVSW